MKSDFFTHWMLACIALSLIIVQSRIGDVADELRKTRLREMSTAEVAAVRS